MPVNKKVKSRTIRLHNDVKTKILAAIAGEYLPLSTGRQLQKYWSCSS